LFETFPLKDCGTRTTEILIFIDCRGKVLEQLKDIKIVESYLSSKRNWNISNITYKAFSENGLYTISSFETYNTTDCADLIMMNCSDKIPRIAAFEESKVWCQKDVNAIRIAFIMDVWFSICDDFYTDVHYEFVKKPNLNIFFIMYRGLDKTRFICFTHNFVPEEDMKNIEYLSEFYSIICDDKHCPFQELTYTSKNVLKSFYHVNFNISELSSNEAKEYCSKIPNNYLLSMETMEEFEFIFQHILLLKISHLHMHITLRTVCHRHPIWSSGFPFLLQNTSEEMIASCSVKYDRIDISTNCLELSTIQYDAFYE
ncbi:hypothetical protein BgiMline_033744, partial [Biomphalaria glabrata]